MDDKEKRIQTVKKKSKIPSLEHVQIDEFLPYIYKNMFFYQEVLNLKAKILQVEEEKQDL